MTTILAVQTPQGAYMGADSQITDGDKRILSPSTPKIVKLGKYLLAVRGDCRPGDILTYNWKPPVYPAGSDPIKFMGAKIIPSIIKAFKENSYEFDKEGNSFGFIIAFAGNIFEIGEDMSISQSSDGIYGIGSGSQFGMGWLAGCQSPELEIEKALGIAARLDIHTCAPFQLEFQKKI